MNTNVVEPRQAVEARAKEEAEKTGGGGSGGGEVSSRFVRECLKANELGDGLLFKHLHTGQFVFNKSMGCWLTWTRHHWEIDKMDRALGAVENVVKPYLEDLEKVETQIR